jgi:transcription antitermination protein NusB
MKGIRRKSREHAMQALFYLDMIGDESLESVEAFYGNFSPSKQAVPFFRKIVEGVRQSKHEIDTTIERFSSNWKLHRMPHVDRNILRIAVFEMLYCDDIPIKVSINEAIDIGKKYGTRESGPFINGILDSLRIAMEKGDMIIKKGDDKDGLEMRCPRLGGPVPFKYCRTTGEEGMPCFKVMDCWWETFDIRTYLQNSLSEEAFKRISEAKPPEKIASILDLIEQAKQRQQKEK